MLGTHVTQALHEGTDLDVEGLLSTLITRPIIWVEGVLIDRAVDVVRGLLAAQTEGDLR